MFDMIICYKETLKLLKKTKGRRGVRKEIPNVRRVDPFQKPLRHITSQCIYGFESSHSPSEVGFGTIVVRTSKTRGSGYSKKIKRKKKIIQAFAGSLENKTKIVSHS